MKSDKANILTSVLVMVVAFILGGLIGWGVTGVSLNNEKGTAPPVVGVGGGPNNTQNELQLTLNNLLREHGNLAILHLQAIYDGKDPLPTGQQLDTNTKQLADLFSARFGNDAGDMFRQMWTDHINQYVNYTEALKANDGDRMNISKQRMEQLAAETGSMLHNLNQNINPGTVTEMMYEHITGTLAVIEAYAKGDQQNLIAEMKKANDLASRFAEYLSGNLMPTNAAPLTSPQ